MPSPIVPLALLALGGLFIATRKKGAATSTLSNKPSGGGASPGAKAPDELSEMDKKLLDDLLKAGSKPTTPGSGTLPGTVKTSLPSTPAAVLEAARTAGFNAGQADRVAGLPRNPNPAGGGYTDPTIPSAYNSAYNQGYDSAAAPGEKAYSGSPVVGTVSHGQGGYTGETSTSPDTDYR